MPAVIFIFYYCIIIKNELFLNKLKTIECIIFVSYYFLYQLLKSMEILILKKWVWMDIILRRNYLNFFHSNEIEKGLTAITAEKNTDEFFFHFLLWMEDYIQEK